MNDLEYIVCFKIYCIVLRMYVILIYAANSKGFKIFHILCNQQTFTHTSFFKNKLGLYYEWSGIKLFS